MSEQRVIDLTEALADSLNDRDPADVVVVNGVRYHREGVVPEGEREHLESRIRALEHLVDQYRSGEVLPDDWTDREEGIEVEVTVREVTGAKIRVHDLHTEEPIEPGPYTLIKREAGDSEEAP